METASQSKLSALGVLPADTLRLVLSFLRLSCIVRLDSAFVKRQEREHHWLVALCNGSGLPWLEHELELEKAECAELLTSNLNYKSRSDVGAVLQALQGSVRGPLILKWLRVRGVPLPSETDVSLLTPQQKTKMIWFLNRAANPTYSASLHGYPSIDEMIKLGVLDRLVEALKVTDHPYLQSEAVSFINDIVFCSRGCNRGRGVVEAGAVPHLVRLLTSTKELNIPSRAFRILREMAGYCAEHRDMVFESVERRLRELQTESPDQDQDHDQDISSHASRLLSLLSLQRPDED